MKISRSVALFIIVFICISFRIDSSEKELFQKNNVIEPSPKTSDSTKYYKDKLKVENNFLEKEKGKNTSLTKKIEELTKEISVLNNKVKEKSNEDKFENGIMDLIKTKIKDYYYIYLILNILLLLFVYFLFSKLLIVTREKKALKNENAKNVKSNSNLGTINSNNNLAQHNSNTTKATKTSSVLNSNSQMNPNSPVVDKNKMSGNGAHTNTVANQTIINTQYSELLSFQNNNYIKQNSIEDWVVLSSSSIGKSHIKSNIKCQDNHSVNNLNKNGWGIAIVCDGAGSASNSDLGSKFVSENLYEIISNKIDSYSASNILPEKAKWDKLSTDSFLQVRENLKEYAINKNISFSSLACTAIVVVFSPNGVLSAHIGDGRAGCLVNDEWVSIINPHKGEESNQTIFLTSDIWHNTSDFKMSNVNVPETNVYLGKVKAFTLMSDGFETHSFECSTFNNDNNKWQDPNIPSSKFFNTLMNQIKSMVENKLSNGKINENWDKFIESGTESIKNESDDKTLVLGVLI